MPGRASLCLRRTSSLLRSRSPRRRDCGCCSTGGNAVDAIARHRDHADRGRADQPTASARTPSRSSGTASKLHGLNASGRSPAAWTPEYFARPDGDAEARLGRGHRAGLRFGVGRAARQVRQAAVRELFEPAIRYAPRRLSGVADDRAAVGRQVARTEDPAGFRAGVHAGRPRAARGRKISSSRHMRARSKTSRRRRAKRSIGASLPKASRRARKQRRRADARTTWRRTRADWVEPHRTWTIAATRCTRSRPNGQGIAALIALGILEYFDLRAPAVDSRRQRCTCRSRR